MMVTRYVDVVVVGIADDDVVVGIADDDVVVGIADDDVVVGNEDIILLLMDTTGFNWWWRSIPKFIPIKIIRFRWGQKNGLIRPRPLPPTPLPRHNLPPPPPRTTYHHNHHYNRLNNNRYYQHRRYYNNNIKYTNTQNLPSLLELNPLPFTIT
ncbi:unnamed protein product [Rotaria sp. Silwood2]|nr:unnamed protein product [Rotaria sp. Silwood2]